MLAKVIAWAPTRAAAIDRLAAGLDETDVRGIVTNMPFLSALVTHPDVRANTIDTGFIERQLKSLTPEAPLPQRSRTRAAVVAMLGDETSAPARTRIRRGGPRAGCRSAGGGGCSRSATGRAASTGQLIYGNGPATLAIGERELAFTTARGCRRLPAHAATASNPTWSP